MCLHEVRAPLAGAYVVFLPVIAGPYPGAADEREARRRIRRVTAQGCDFFLDLTEEGELEPYAHLLPGRVRHLRVALGRNEVPRPERMREVLDALNRASARDGYGVYVHDADGTGRVGTVVGCWLADMQVVSAGLDVLDFLDRLRSEIPGRRPSPATAEQRAFVRGWTRGQQPRALLRGAEPDAAQALEGGMQ
jgi:Swiss Army Knife protein, DSP-PTPase phosphatase domain